MIVDVAGQRGYKTHLSLLWNTTFVLVCNSFYSRWKSNPVFIPWDVSHNFRRTWRFR